MTSGLSAGYAGREPVPGLAYVRARAASLLDFLVPLWVASGALVMFEPSPYEVAFLLVLPVAVLGGMAIVRGTLGLLAIFVAFIPFALIGAFQATFLELPQALLFQIVTIFLLFTAYFVANYVAEAPQYRMALIVKGYMVGAVVSALIGTLGYLGLIPGAELFTRYGRAKAFFQDPNVFGPFLILPAMYALQRILLGDLRRALIAGVLFGILFIGVFVSFSRAAWGHLALSALILFALVFVFEANAREKARMLMIAIAGTMMLVVALGGLLSVPQVQRLFEIRASAQNYDEGETGRFGRQGYAFELALENPLGIGPLEFRNLRIREEPHNSYVNVLHVYGWGGGAIYFLLVLLTLKRAGGALIRPSPNRLLLLPLIATYIPLIGEAAIIDTDHWRHYFLVTGLIWGVTAGYFVTRPKESARTSLV